jgi:hypothetical protein
LLVGVGCMTGGVYPGLGPAAAGSSIVNEQSTPHPASRATHKARGTEVETFMGDPLRSKRFSFGMVSMRTATHRVK